MKYGSDNVAEKIKLVNFIIASVGKSTACQWLGSILTIFHCLSRQATKIYGQAKFMCSSPVSNCWRRLFTSRLCLASNSFVCVMYGAGNDFHTIFSWSDDEWKKKTTEELFVNHGIYHHHYRSGNIVTFSDFHTLIVYHIGQ